MTKQNHQRVLAFYTAARLRARSRKSAWNLILIPPALFGWLGSWYGLFRIVWAFHQTLYPQHTFHDFWQGGVSFASFVPGFLMLFAPAPGSICLGLILANCVAWLIPPARRTLETEAEGYKGTGFRDSTETLLRLAIWALPSGLIIALIAASLLRALR